MFQDVAGVGWRAGDVHSAGHRALDLRRLALAQGPHKSLLRALPKCLRGRHGNEHRFERVFYIQKMQ